MNRHFPLSAEARIVFSDPARCLPQIARHLEGHGAQVSWLDGAAVLDFDFSRGVLRPGGDLLTLHAEAMDRSLLQEIENELAEHVVEFTTVRPADIVWHGDESASGTPPNFRLMRVAETRRLTPHMQRIRFTGDNLLRFSSLANLHCKLLIPPAVIAPEWPFLDAEGSFRWPSGPGKPTVRKYTIRSIDPAEGWLDIDFVLHAKAGPGSAWAESAKAGDTVGIVGPGGRSVPIRENYLLAGDETALPAIARLLESLPGKSRGLALIEVHDAREEQTLNNKTGIEVRWLHRNEATSGASGLLANAIQSLPTPTCESPFAWVSCEFSSFKTIRSFLRKQWRLDRESHLVTSYWRRGWSEDRAESLQTVSGHMMALGQRLGLDVG